MNAPLRLLVPALLAVARCFGGSSVPDMPEALRADATAVIAAATNVTAARFPDAHAVTVDDRLHTVYEADGADVTWDDEWVKVLTEKGRRAHAAITLDFNARYGDAGIFCVEIVGTNGQIRAVDFRKSLKIATDNSSMDANIVDPMDKTLRCAVPGLAVGEIRHIRFYRRNAKPRMKNAWADVTALEYKQPIVSTVVSVDSPTNRPLVHAVVRHPFAQTCVRAPDETRPDGRTRLKWTVRDVPQMFDEPNMPPLLSCVQTLHLSTVRDWKDVSRWYWSICTNHLAKTTPAMTNEVVKLTKDCTTPRDRIRALFKFVAQDVRYMGLTLEDDVPGYEPHDVDVTFANRYGVCRDKAALLVALLRIAGFDAYPVLIHTGAKRDPDIPNPFFNHAVVAVADTNAPCGYTLMDPTDESSKDVLPDYLCNKSFLVAHPAGETLRTSPVTDVRENLLQVDSTGTFSPEGSLLLETRFAFNGINDSLVRDELLSRRPSKRRLYIADVWKGAVPAAELLSCEIEPKDLRQVEKPFRVKTVVRIPDTILRGKTRDAIPLPFVTRGFNIAQIMLHENTALEKRRFPLVLPMTAGAEETLRLTLGDGVGKPVHLPEYDAFATNGYAFALNAVCTSGVLTATRRLEVNALEFDVPTYQALRDLCKEAETADHDQPQFAARDREDDASFNVLRSETIVHFTSPRTWVETNIVEKKIVGRNGLKRASELKIPYAPSTRTVELVSATVSNRNGRVASVTPQEINVMDCGWAASAPRYPASKILVANLPAVEIGSVLRTIVVKTVTNAPTAFTCHGYAGSVEPYGFERFEFHVPDGMTFAWREKGLTHTETNGVYCWSWSNPERIPNEPSQPPYAKWRPTFSVSTADWQTQQGGLVAALARARAQGSDAARRTGAELTKTCTTPQERITAIRTFMATHLRTAGPGLFELPFDRAFSTPDQALADASASRADTRNLLFSLLEGAGFDCAFVLAADGDLTAEKTCRRVPFPSTFDSLVIRAVWTDGWLPFLRDKTVFWIAGENEYTPAEASAWLDDSFYDPAADTFGTIGEGVDDAWRTRKESTWRMSVRENGAVDFDIALRTWGAGVGSFRKTHTEILPEMRSRLHQQLLGLVSQNATATSDFTTDTESYPSLIAFSAYVDRYAQITDGTLTLDLDQLMSEAFPVNDTPRTSPIALSKKNPQKITCEIVLPRGWTEIERLPDAFTLRNPKNNKEIWIARDVVSRHENGHLIVTVTHTSQRAHATILSADYAALLREWNRRLAAPAARTIIVRKAP